VKDRDLSLVTHTTTDAGDMAIILVTDPKMVHYVGKTCCLNFVHVQCKIKLCLTQSFFLANLPYGHMVIGPEHIPGPDTKFSSENERTQEKLPFPCVLVRFCIIIRSNSTSTSRSSTVYIENLLTMDHTNTTPPITPMGQNKQ